MCWLGFSLKHILRLQRQMVAEENDEKEKKATQSLSIAKKKQN